MCYATPAEPCVFLSAKFDYLYSMGNSANIVSDNLILAFEYHIKCGNDVESDFPS